MVNDDQNEPQLVMPPLREIKVTDKNEHKKQADARLSPKMNQRIDTDMEQENFKEVSAQLYTGSSKQIILRAQAGKLAVENYDLRYLDDLIQRQLRQSPSFFDQNDK